MRSSRSKRLVAFALSLLVLPAVRADKLTIPAGTEIYGELEEQVTSRKKETELQLKEGTNLWFNCEGDCIETEGRTLGDKYFAIIGLGGGNDTELDLQIGNDSTIWARNFTVMFDGHIQTGRLNDFQPVL